jgi:hypothetical protein
MTVPIFIPAQTTFHPDVVPYISTTDYANAPTAVSTTDLVPGGNAQANLVEFANVIRRASGWANSLCHQILAATLDVQARSGLYVRRDGTVRVVCDFWPVLEVDTFLAGPSPSTMSAITDPADMALIGRKVLSVPVSGMSGNSVGNLQFPGPLRPGDRAYCQWGYWNGWPHTTLAATLAHGGSTLVVTNAMPPALAGRAMTIWDGPLTEQVQIAASFTGGTSLPLVGVTLNDHTLPAAPALIMVSTFPDDMRQGVISLTSALIKVRGAESYDMPSVGAEPSKEALIEGGGLEDLAVAVDVLAQYRAGSRG